MECSTQAIPAHAYREVLVGCVQGKANELGELLSLVLNGVVGWMWD